MTAVQSQKRHLRAEKALQRHGHRRREPLRGRGARGQEGLLHAAPRARQREVHPLPPLRRGLPAAARRRDRREQPRLRYRNRLRVRAAAQPRGVRLLRPVHQRLPDRRAHRKRQHAGRLNAINDPDKIVIVQTAPAVRAALGEEFGLPIGTNVEGKMVAALRRLGFDKVFDTDFGADMTITGGSERVHRPREERRQAADHHLLLARLESSSASTITRTSRKTSPPASRRSR